MANLARIVPAPDNSGACVKNVASNATPASDEFSVPSGRLFAPSERPLAADGGIFQLESRLFATGAGLFIPESRRVVAGGRLFAVNRRRFAVSGASPDVKSPPLGASSAPPDAESSSSATGDGHFVAINRGFWPKTSKIVVLDRPAGRKGWKQPVKAS